MLTWILTAMMLLSPHRDHAALGAAIADVVAEEPPLFRDDEDRAKTAALLVAIAYRESSFVADVVGDHGQSFCAFQIHRSSGGSPALLEDPRACARAALAMLRTSMRTCPAHPVAWYASGPGGCANARAQRISRDRMAVAAWLRREVKP